MRFSPSVSSLSYPLAARRLRRGALLAGTVGLVGLALAGCKKDDDTNSGAAALGTVFYVESNLAATGQNSILAYRLRADGSLETLPGSPFATGGAGIANPSQALGPDDTDEPLALSADKKRLFAVNQGSHTVAVFDIGADGKLAAVAGSPFASGGTNPCSIGVAGSRLYVVNQSNDGNPATTEPAPNYTAFDVAASGALTPVAGSTVTTGGGASPAHAYVAPNQRLLFVDDFLAFAAPAPAGTLRAFALGADGKLTAAPGTPQAVPQVPPAAMAGGALGLWGHPTQNVLYVGFPMQSKIGVYTYDGATGAPTFVRAVDSGSPAPAPAGVVCWLRVNKAGTRLYALNTGQNSVSVFDLATPQQPVILQTLALKTPGPLFDTMGPAGMLVSSQAFHLTLSPDEQTLLVVSQHATPVFTTNYNYLHALRIGSDGKLSEPTEPVQPLVPATARPQGAVGVAL